MIKLRGRASAAVIAVMLTTGGAGSLGLITATSAQAGNDVCPNQVYNGTIRSSLNNYLDDYGGGSQTYVHTYQLTYSSNQTWCVEKASETRGGFFIHPNNNLGLCLDIHQYSDDYPVWVYTCNGSNPQRWCWNGRGYFVTWVHSNIAIKDQGRYHVVDVVTSGANQWYTNGATFADNC